MEANFEACARLAATAKEQQAELLCLPECFNFIGSSGSESVSIAEPLDGPIITRYCQLARDQTIWLSLGGFQEKGPDEEHVYNSHLIVNSDGEIVHTYRKMHLFEVDLPTVSLHESNFTTAGSGSDLAVCDSPIGKLGPTICYDMRFAETYLTLAEMGADVLLMPSAFTVKTGMAHWEVLLRARAIECQCYVIAAAQVGTHNQKRESYGHAMIVDPWGTVVAHCSNKEGVAVADIDLEWLNTVRAQMPVADHRRRDVYGSFNTKAPQLKEAPAATQKRAGNL
jgi:predicted amidohydrolase